MATNYVVRRFCSDCNEHKYERQTDATLDLEFVPEGCESHTLGDAVIEHKEEV